MEVAGLRHLVVDYLFRYVDLQVVNALVLELVRGARLGEGEVGTLVLSPVVAVPVPPEPNACRRQRTTSSSSLEIVRGRLNEEN